jgi:hypothetical protein
VPANVQAPGAVAYVTSNNDFYRIDTSLFPPQIDPATVASADLRTGAESDHDQLGRPAAAADGAALRDARVRVERGRRRPDQQRPVARYADQALLDEVQPLPDADQVVQRSVDGWTCGTPTAVLRDGRDALLAIGMNGQPLPIEHGFPVRMVVPGLYGYVSACKWIYEIELTRFADFDAYWVPRGLVQQARSRRSRASTRRAAEPAAGRRRGRGRCGVGAAPRHQQGRGTGGLVARGQRRRWPARCPRTPWRQWWYRWPATPGEHTLRVRATDRPGRRRRPRPRRPAPNGADRMALGTGVDRVVRSRTFRPAR